MGDRIDIGFIRVVVQILGIPIPSRSGEGVLRVFGQVGVSDEVDLESIACLPVVGAAGQLQAASTVEAGAVTGPVVSEVLGFTGFRT